MAYRAGRYAHNAFSCLMQGGGGGVGGRQVTKRSTHARPGMQLQPCSAIRCDAWYLTYQVLHAHSTENSLTLPPPGWATGISGLIDFGINESQSVKAG